MKLQRSLNLLTVQIALFIFRVQIISQFVHSGGMLRRINDVENRKKNDF